MTKEQKKLLEDHKNLILAEARKNATNLPLEAVQIEAYRIANAAVKDYDPKVSKFSTHLTNSLKKLSRFSTQYGQVVRLPENQQFILNKINKAEKELDAQLGREPTIDELSNFTKLSIQVINNVLQNRKQTVNLANMVDSPIFVPGNNDEYLHFCYHDMSPIDKLIFEHRTGFGNKPVLSNEALAKKLNIAPSTLSNRIKMISDKIEEGWKDD